MVLRGSQSENYKSHIFWGSPKFKIREQGDPPIVLLWIFAWLILLALRAAVVPGPDLSRKGGYLRNSCLDMGVAQNLGPVQVGGFLVVSL